MRPRLRRRSLRSLVLVAGLACVTAVGLTASNVVAASKRVNTSAAVDVNELKPASCNGITLTAYVINSGTFSATGAAELVIASAGVDNPNGAGGNDCVLGGGSDDNLRGVPGPTSASAGPERTRSTPTARRRSSSALLALSRPVLAPLGCSPWSGDRRSCSTSTAR